MGPNKLDLDNFRLHKLRANYQERLDFAGRVSDREELVGICIIENHQ